MMGVYVVILVPCLDGTFSESCMIDQPLNQKPQFTILDELLYGFSGGDVYPCQAYDRILITTEQWVNYFNVTT